MIIGGPVRWMVVAILVTTVGLSAAEHAKRPNIVFFLTDDQSGDTLGFTGGEVYTPRIDAMAANGLHLTNFNVTSTVCSPSRYSFMTGRYAGRCTGPYFMQIHPEGTQTQVENNCELELDRWNIAKILQANGYRTGFVGKSHIVRHGDWVRSRGLAKWGMDDDPRDPAISALMRESHQQLCDEMKPYGFDYVDGVYAANLRELFCKALYVHNLDWTIDKSLTFLDQTTRDQPFFLFVSTTLHHGPTPIRTENGMTADPRLTGEGWVEEGFDVLPSREELMAKNREAGFKDNQAYAYWLDSGVGAILDKLEAMGVTEETLVVFVPDHGTSANKSTLYDQGCRVPMVCYWPGKIDPGTTYDRIVANIDFAPTILDVAGIEPPSDYVRDGLSFKPVLEGSQEPLREALMLEMGHARAIKTDDWKYIAVRYPQDVQAQIDRGEKFQPYLEDDPKLDRPYYTRNRHLGHHSSRRNENYFTPDQLYNINADPGEDNNLFESNPELAEKMRGYLKDKLSSFDQRPFGDLNQLD